MRHRLSVENHPRVVLCSEWQRRRRRRRMLFHCHHSQQQGPWGLKCGVNPSVFGWGCEGDLDKIWMMAVSLFHEGAALCKPEWRATGTVTLWKSKDKRWAEKCQTSRTERARQHWEAFQWCSPFADKNQGQRRIKDCQLHQWGQTSASSVSQFCEPYDWNSFQNCVPVSKKWTLSLFYFLNITACRWFNPLLYHLCLQGHLWWWENTV